VRRAWLVARKDIKEAFGRRDLVIRFGIVSLLLPVFYGVLAGSAVRTALQRHQPMGAALGSSVPLFAAMAAVLGVIVAISVTAHAIAGEKERRTLEALLATPASDLEIFAGKVLAASLPAMITGYGSGVLFFVAARLAAGGWAMASAPAMVAAAEIIAVGVPVCTIILAAAGVIVSARCSTAASAQQISSLLLFPLFGLVIYGGLRFSRLSAPALVLVFAGLLALCLVLLLLGARSLGREELIARLD
jgi:ABC-2 type transport system permease protein